jgi:hypothetical protein
MAQFPTWTLTPPGDYRSELTLTTSYAGTNSSGGSVNGATLQHVVFSDTLNSASLQLLPETESFTFSREGTYAWATFFKPCDPSRNVVTVPAQWADFFTPKLLSPQDFESSIQVSSIEKEVFS